VIPVVTTPTNNANVNANDDATASLPLEAPLPYEPHICDVTHVQLAPLPSLVSDNTNAGNDAVSGDSLQVSRADMDNDSVDSNMSVITVHDDNNRRAARNI
jgi:hypothetical protein